MNYFALRLSRPFRFGLQFAALAGLLHAAGAAVTWHDVQFGGFASQGFLANTGDNDYFGETSDGTFDFREYGVNGSWSKGRWRMGAQLFAQRIGDYGHDQITLDWATVDYQVNDWFGLRVGRVKTPRGLYNESLDLDSLRPFVLLPQGVYDARLRDFNAAFNGAMIYGNVSLKSAGSLDYRAYYGDIPIALNSGAADYFGNGVPVQNQSFGMDSTLGGSLFWTTPIPGLRTGYSYSLFQNLAATTTVHLPDGSIETATKGTDAYERHLLSVEYTVGDWVLAAEVGKEHALYGIGLPGQTAFLGLASDTDYHYLAVSRRLTPRLEAGAYYSHSEETTEASGIEAGFPFPNLQQDDYAVSLRFDLNDHVLFKLEGHYLDGSGKVFDTLARPQPFGARDETWTMIAAKMTFSF